MTADKFCKYFTSIGLSLASAIPAVNPNFRLFLMDNKSNPIILKPTTTIELVNIPKKLASGKASGYFNVPMHVIKSSFHLIPSPLGEYY